MNRRSFIKRSFAYIVIAETVLLNTQRTVWAAILKGERDFFSAGELQTLKAYIDTLIPKTKNGPSGTDAGVIQYLLKMFRDELPRLRRIRFIGAGKTASALLPTYKNLLKRLDEITLAKFQKKFAAASEEERVLVLENLSENSGQQVGYQIKGTDLNQALTDSDLFKLSRTHCVQGYFADPKYGGNRKYLAWDSIKHICHFNYQKVNAACEKHDAS